MDRGLVIVLCDIKPMVQRLEELEKEFEQSKAEEDNPFRQRLSNHVKDMEELVGAHVMSMVEFWVRMDERYGEPLVVADEVRKEL